MKTNEEPNVRKEEVKAENKQRRMLKDEELEQVGGGSNICDGCEYNSNGACRSYRTMGRGCPHGFA